MLASSEGQEWRGHVEQTKKHEEAIQAALPITSTQLAVVGNEVGTLRYRGTAGIPGESTPVSVGVGGVR